MPERRRPKKSISRAVREPQLVFKCPRSGLDNGYKKLNLYCANLGSGPDIVLVHGWAWHGGVWAEVAAELAHEFQVWIPDLPGHGRSGEEETEFTLDNLAPAVGAHVPREAIWIGWSFGGLVALAAAQRGWARRLVLVGTTPRFVQGEHWECGLAREWFDGFTEELGRDVRRALERFVSLHGAGNGNERPLLRRLRSEIFRFGIPGPRALNEGLKLLAQSDLRSSLPQIRVPTLIVQGARDQIAPLLAGRRLAQALVQARFVSVGEAGHAPFLSHADAFLESVRSFLRE